jgi:hypothetical protein
LKVSPNGAPILSGSGLQQVKERIEQRFARAREAGVTSLVPTKPPAHRSPPLQAEVEVVPAKPLRPLAEQAAVLVRVAARRFANTAAKHPRTQESYCVVDVRETVDELFAAAIEAIERDVSKQQTKTERHEIKEAS